MTPIDVKEVARSVGLHDVFGDGQNWQSQEGKSVTLQDLERFAAAVLAMPRRTWNVYRDRVWMGHGQGVTEAAAIVEMKARCHRVMHDGEWVAKVADGAAPLLLDQPGGREGVSGA